MTSDFKDLIYVGSAIVGAVGLGISAYNSWTTVKANRAKFWLDLRNHFYRFDDVHRKLRPGGAWAGSIGAPETVEEWAQTEAYMGLFEHCERMLQDGLIDEKHFKQIYRYRLINLVANDRIRIDKLIARAEGWVLLRQLIARFDIPVKP